MSVADSLAGIDKRWYRWAWTEGDDVVVEGCRGGILEYQLDREILCVVGLSLFSCLILLLFFQAHTVDQGVQLEETWGRQF